MLYCISFCAIWEFLSLIKANKYVLGNDGDDDDDDDDEYDDCFDVHRHEYHKYTFVLLFLAVLKAHG